MQQYLLILLLLPILGHAQETLETIEVLEDKGGSFSEFWEENKEGQIFSGKKNTITNLKKIPRLQTNNYRQATSQTAGLLVSEVPNESLAAISYRGLGDPHETFNILLLQDGLPVAADMYGYPAHYFSPALPMMEKVQFIRGGAGLTYGPQPGGALNYVSRPLTRNQPTSGKLGLTGGSYQLLTTNNAHYGSSGNNSYALEYFRRQGNGPQRINSDFAADYVQVRNHHFAGKNKYKLFFNGYNSDHGNSGGFSKVDNAGSNPYGVDQGRATRRHDRLKVARAQFAAGVESRLDATSELHLTLWGTAYKRYSKTQNTTGSTFGTFPTGINNTIVSQNYYGYNAQARYLKNYEIGENTNTFSAGYLFYNLISPLVQETGDRPDANHGTVTKRFDRQTNTNSAFVENRFSFGRMMVTPGLRVENIRQTVEERKGGDRKADGTVNVPLLGLGLAYHASENSQIYANVSEAYKPVTYTDAVPTTTTTISEDIDPSKILTTELGYRGQTNLLNWDISTFYIRYENKFGTVGTGTVATIQNTGAGTHYGMDAAGELKLLGNFNLYANFAYLDAEFTQSGKATVDVKGKTPQYAPRTITRAGLIYSQEDALRLALMGVMVDRHYGNDNNTAQFEIPYYMVWDLTGDFTIKKNWVISTGINNLLDRDYYSRVRSDGVAWALGRNYYAGVSFKY